MISKETINKFYQAYRSLISDIQHFFKNKRISYIRPIKLHIGCGNIIKDGWVNIDRKPPADLQIDVCRGLPYDTNSCEIIYTEHFLEHLAWPDENIPFLADCYRVLKSGGIISIGVPDSKFVVVECLKDIQNFQAMVSEHKWGYPDYCKTAFEYINYHFRLNGHHKFAYDVDTLQAHLEQVGFINVCQRIYNPGLDSENRAAGTIYMDGTKGA